MLTPILHLILLKHLPNVILKEKLIYTVKSGDTLWDMLHKYSGVSRPNRTLMAYYRDLRPSLTFKI